jgi:hypothetical protein
MPLSYQFRFNIKPQMYMTLCLQLNFILQFFLASKRKNALTYQNEKEKANARRVLFLSSSCKGPHSAGNLTSAGF